MKTIFARKLTCNRAIAFEILPFVFYVPKFEDPVRVLERSNLLVQLSVPLLESDLENLLVETETFEFEIEQSVFERLYLEIADLIGFTRASSHGHFDVTDPLFISALIAAATQRRTKTKLGAELFEQSRQLFLDLEVGQVNDYPTEIVRGELEAAWLYYSIFSDITGFYRHVEILDLENWGVRGWSINVLRFIERSVAKNYTSGFLPTISARDRWLAQPLLHR